MTNFVLWSACFPCSSVPFVTRNMKINKKHNGEQIVNVRLVLVGAVPPGAGREGGEREAGRQRGAMDPSPGGSGRYRPAVARVGGEGGEEEARGGRRAGGFGREGGESPAGQRLADVASSDLSTSASR